MAIRPPSEYLMRPKNSFNGDSITKVPMKTLIVDDERLARKELMSLLEPHKKIDVVGEATDVDDAIEKINELNPDLIFLDIQMPGKSGFDLLESLDHVPRVIFTTAYDEFALKAFEVNAPDYLLETGAARAVGRGHCQAPCRI